MMNGMVFRRRSNALRPIDSNKNVVNDLAIIAAAGQRDNVIALAVDSAALAAVTNVERGCTINQIYIECWLYGNAVAGVNSRISWYLMKNPGGNLVEPDPSIVGPSDNKKFIFAQGTGLVGNSGNGQPGYLIRGWFSVPKRYRRMGANDAFVLSIKNDTANDVNQCFLIIYKWYK